LLEHEHVEHQRLFLQAVAFPGQLYQLARFEHLGPQSL
jgi:hypothetical protein